MPPAGDYLSGGRRESLWKGTHVLETLAELATLGSLGLLIWQAAREATTRNIRCGHAPEKPCARDDRDQ